MLLDVLGCDGTYPGPGSATAGFLARSGRSVLWMDAGVGTLSELMKRISLDQLSAAAISHGHIDHSSDLAIYHHAAAYGPLRLAPLPLYAPDGVFERLAASSSGVLDSFELRRVDQGDAADLGEMRLEFGPANHSAPAVSMRLTNASGSLVYTGDTGWDDRLVRFSAGADLLLSEATIVGRPRGENGHQSATEAGRLASAAGVRRLVLVHIPPHLDRTQAVAEAQSEYDGEVIAAEPGMVIEVGAP